MNLKCSILVVLCQMFLAYNVYSCEQWIRDDFIALRKTRALDGRLISYALPAWKLVLNEYNSISPNPALNTTKTKHITMEFFKLRNAIKQFICDSHFYSRDTLLIKNNDLTELPKCNKCNGDGLIEKKRKCIMCIGTGRIKNVNFKPASGNIYFKRSTGNNMVDICTNCEPNNMNGSASSGKLNIYTICNKCLGTGFNLKNVKGNM